MSFNKPGEEGQTKIPIGLALMVLGVIILLIAASIWALAPLNVPERLEPAFVPTLTPSDAPNPFVPDQSQQQQMVEVPILLPETPLEAASEGLPSFAAVSDAPTSYNTSVSGQPVRLVIPKLNIDAAVHQSGLLTLFDGGTRYFQWAVPAGYAAGWHETSAALGEPGNTVLNGHNNIYGEVFRDLVDLEFGDQITLYDNEGNTFTYEVQERELLAENGQPISVRIENAQWIEATDDERVTLVSCWPYATNAYRVVVIARPVVQSAGG